MMPLRIALLDDHAVVRHGLVSALRGEHEFLIVGVYGKSRDAVVGLALVPADLLILDFTLGPGEIDGVSLIRALRVKYPNCRILVLSADEDTAIAALALRVGARGFVGKGADMKELIGAVRTVASGSVYLSEDMSYRVSTTGAIHAVVNSYVSEVGLKVASLSAREQEVIRCYLAGMTVTEIAEKFKRSIKTVSTQKVTAFRKLGVTSNNGLFKMRYATDLKDCSKKKVIAAPVMSGRRG